MISPISFCCPAEFSTAGWMKVPWCGRRTSSPSSTSICNARRTVPRDAAKSSQSSRSVVRQRLLSSGAAAAIRVNTYCRIREYAVENSSVIPAAAPSGF